MAEELRRSQVITNFGVGAITDMKEFSGVLKSPDVWAEVLTPVGRMLNEERIEEVRLANRLSKANVNPHLEFFVMPPRKKDNYGDSIKLPFTLFPRMLYCKSCGSLKSFNEWFPSGLDYPNNIRCTEIKNRKRCNGKLIPSRFIMICPKGHLDDFPYSEWVHNYKECNHPLLKISFSGSSSSLSSVIIKCDNCNKKRSMAGALSPGNHSDEFVCRGNRPELYTPLHQYTEGCGVNVHHLKFVLRNASNVYFPKIYSSISIPPFADSIVQDLLVSHKFQTIREYYNENKQDLFAAVLNDSIQTWVNLYKKEEGFFRLLLNQLLDPKSQDQDEETYRHAEFNAFINEPDTEQNNFVIERMEINDELINYGVNFLIKAVRIREVRVLAGYSRVRPYDSESPITDAQPEQELTNMRTVFNKIVNLNDNLRLKFLPGVENFGEGIFISFNNENLQNIENFSVVSLRAAILQQNMQRNIYDGGRNIPFNARYVALHTLSHLLIKRLAFDSGYSTASIRERIYCDVLHNGNPMNAIFLYTVDTDSEGTMGGLCRLAEPLEISEIINIALEESEWCSSDPVCRESQGQGLGSLNLAACHSCCLLPETSCESGNRLLDRTIMDSFFKQ